MVNMPYTNKGLWTDPTVQIPDGDVKMMAPSIAAKFPSVNRAIRR
jgi:hypothetical protein